MYTIELTSGDVVYDSRYPDQYPVIEAKLNKELNEADSLEFTLLPGHPLYTAMHRMRTFVLAKQDNEELFYGRVLTTDKDLYGQLQVHCEGAYTFFLDSEMEKASPKETVAAFFSRCINAHNSQVEPAKQFTVGMCTSDKANEEMDFKIEDYSQTKSVLESMLTSKHGGYFRVRPNPNGPRFFDYIQTYDHVCTQNVKIAENIAEKQDHVSGENLFTILRPLGKNNLDISDQSQSSITIPNCVKDGNKLKLTNMIETYGSIIHTERFSEIDKADVLLKAAEDFIRRRGSQLPGTCEVTFVDWHLMNPEIMKVSLGDTFTNIEGFEGQTMTVGSLDIDITNPGESTMTLKNAEEIEANDPASSSGSLSSSYASKCTHIDYVYKYIHEGENTLQLMTDQIDINARNLKLTADEVVQISSITSYLTANHLFLIAEEKNGEPGKIELKVAKNLSDDEEHQTQIVATLGNVNIYNSNLIVEGYVKAEELEAAVARIDDIETDYIHNNDTSQNLVIGPANFAGHVSAPTLEVDEGAYIEGLTSLGTELQGYVIMRGADVQLNDSQKVVTSLTLDQVSVMGSDGTPFTLTYVKGGTDAIIPYYYGA